MRAERVVIPRDHPAYAGHFPSDPLVPGSMLLDLIIAAWGSDCAGVRSAKFHSPVEPGAALDLVFTPVSGGSLVRFVCRRGERTVCSGVLDSAPARG